MSETSSELLISNDISSPGSNEDTDKTLTNTKQISNNHKNKSDKSKLSLSQSDDKSEHYVRLLKESQNDASNRDILIGMLQKQLKKMEDLYKKSLDQQQDLRLKYSSIVQELGNLKSISNKLKEENDRLLKEIQINETQHEEEKGALKAQAEKWKKEYDHLLIIIENMDKNTKALKEALNTNECHNKARLNSETMEVLGGYYKNIQEALAQQNLKLDDFLQKFQIIGDGGCTIIKDLQGIKCINKQLSDSIASAEVARKSQATKVDSDCTSCDETISKRSMMEDKLEKGGIEEPKESAKSISNQVSSKIPIYKKEGDIPNCCREEPKSKYCDNEQQTDIIENSSMNPERTPTISEKISEISKDSCKTCIDDNPDPKENCGLTKPAVSEKSSTTSKDSYVDEDCKTFCCDESPVQKLLSADPIVHNPTQPEENSNDDSNDSLEKDRNTYDIGILCHIISSEFEPKEQKHKCITCEISCLDICDDRKACSLPMYCCEQSSFFTHVSPECSMGMYCCERDDLPRPKPRPKKEKKPKKEKTPKKKKSKIKSEAIHITFQREYNDCSHKEECLETCEKSEPISSNKGEKCNVSAKKGRTEYIPQCYVQAEEPVASKKGEKCNICAKKKRETECVPRCYVQTEVSGESDYKSDIDDNEQAMKHTACCGGSEQIQPSDEDKQETLYESSHDFEDTSPNPGLCKKCCQEHSSCKGSKCVNVSRINHPTECSNELKASCLPNTNIGGDVTTDDKSSMTDSIFIDLVEENSKLRYNIQAMSKKIETLKVSSKRDSSVQSPDSYDKLMDDRDTLYDTNVKQKNIINELEDKNEELNEKLVNNERAMNEAVKAKTDAIERSNTLLSEYEASLRNTNGKYAMALSEIDNLKEQNDTLTNKLNLLNQSVKQHKEQTCLCKRETEEMRKKAMNLESALRNADDELRSKNSKYFDELADKSAALSESLAKYEKLKKDYANLLEDNKDIDLLKKKNTNLIHELDQKDLMIATMKKQINGLEKELNGIKDEIHKNNARASKEMDALLDACSDLENKLETTQEILHKESCFIDDEANTSFNDENYQEIEALRTELQDKTKETQQLIQKLDVMRSSFDQQIQALKDQNELLRFQLEHEQEAHERELDEHEEKLNKLMEKVTNAEKTVKSKFKDSQEYIERCNQTDSKSLEKIPVLTAQLEESVQKNTLLKEELDESKQKLSTLKEASSQLGLSKAENMKLKSKITELQRQLRDVQDVEETMKKLKAEKEQLNVKVQYLENQITTLKKSRESINSKAKIPTQSTDHMTLSTIQEEATKCPAALLDIGKPLKSCIKTNRVCHCSKTNQQITTNARVTILYDNKGFGKANNTDSMSTLDSVQSGWSSGCGNRLNKLQMRLASINRMEEQVKEMIATVRQQNQRLTTCNSSRLRHQQDIDERLHKLKHKREQLMDSLTTFQKEIREVEYNNKQKFKELQNCRNNKHT